MRKYLLFTSCFSSKTYHCINVITLKTFTSWLCGDMGAATSWALSALEVMPCTSWMMSPFLIGTWGSDTISSSLVKKKKGMHYKFSCVFKIAHFKLVWKISNFISETWSHPHLHFWLLDNPPIIYILIAITCNLLLVWGTSSISILYRIKSIMRMYPASTAVCVAESNLWPVEDLDRLVGYYWSQATL